MSGWSTFGRRLRARAPLPRRSTPTRLLASQLVSVAGLAGRPVTNQAGLEIGTVRDVVARWDDATYPAVSGFVVRVGRRSSFLHAGQVAELRSNGIALRSSKLDLRDYARRDGELALGRDVIDHQLIDVDGARVVRASDLYLADIAGTFRLVGVDVGFNSLLRRLGPVRWRDRPTPTRVIDWATVQPTSAPGEAVRIARTRDALHRLRPAELATLIEDLGAAQRQAVVDALDPAVAADVLEEMTADPLEELLAGMPDARAAALLTDMAPDEAAEALRSMDDDRRDELLTALPAVKRAEMARLLDYDEDTAGSVMTPVMVLVSADATIEGVLQRLAERADDRGDIDGILIVDGDGRLVDDVSLFELALADRNRPVGSLIAPPYPVTVSPTADLEEVVERFIESRDTSLVVIDDDQRPVGRILADDIIDALVADRRLGRHAS